MRNEYAKFVLEKKIFYSKEINVYTSSIFDLRLIFLINDFIRN